jgi:hypothetical protein
MEHSKIGATAPQVVKVRNPSTVEEIEAELGDIYLHCFTWHTDPNADLSTCLYKADLILPNAHLTYWSNTDDLEFTRHAVFTLNENMKRVINVEHKDYLRKRILTSLRMHLANVEAYCKVS